MAANSTAELIVQNIVTTLEAVSSITTVQRTRPFFNDKQYLDIEDDQLPLIAVVGQLPKPEAKRSNSRPFQIDFFTSDLDIDLAVYDKATANPDQRMYNLCDDIWAGLFNDISRNSLALGTDILPEMERGLVHPHIVFYLTARVTYQHDTTGI